MGEMQTVAANMPCALASHHRMNKCGYSFFGLAPLWYESDLGTI